MYAIIATGGKQYKVAEGDVIRVEKLGVEAGETVTFDNVIAVSNDGLKAGEDVISSFSLVLVNDDFFILSVLNYRSGNTGILNVFSNL